MSEKHVEAKEQDKLVKPYKTLYVVYQDHDYGHTNACSCMAFDTIEDARKLLAMYKDVYGGKYGIDSIGYATSDKITEEFAKNYFTKWS